MRMWVVGKFLFLCRLHFPHFPLLIHSFFPVGICFQVQQLFLPFIFFLVSFSLSLIIQGFNFNWCDNVFTRISLSLFTMYYEVSSLKYFVRDGGPSGMGGLPERGARKEGLNRLGFGQPLLGWFMTKLWTRIQMVYPWLIVIRVAISYELFHPPRHSTEVNESCKRPLTILKLSLS